MLDLAPPHLAAEAGARKAALRIHFAGRWKGAGNGHAAILQDVRDSHEALDCGGDQCDPAYRFQHNFVVRFPSRRDWEENEKELFSPGGLIWYTDGSKTKTGTGAGIWGERPRVERSIALGPHVSVFQAEVHAIRACARLNLDKGYEGKHIYICSDSRAALGSLHNTVMRSSLVLDCVDTLTQLANNNRVSLLWVPGHAGVKGNEGANDSAREGARKPNRDPSCTLGVSMGTAKEWTRCWIRQQLGQLWERTQQMGHAKALLKRPSKKIGAALSRLDRSYIYIGYIPCGMIPRVDERNMSAKLKVCVSRVYESC